MSNTKSKFSGLPFVLGLGVPKAGTTWIHHQLESHPEISITTTKEIGYWSRNYAKGPDWYLHQFAVKPEHKIYAEFTPHYLNERSLARIASQLTQAKFIVSVRNPYERAFSDYLNKLRNGEITVGFREALTMDPRILADSLYGKQIYEYLRYFSLDQLHIVALEEIENDPMETVRMLYQFIGVRDFTPKHLERKINVGRDRSLSDRFLKSIEIVAKQVGIERKHLKMLGIDILLEKYQSLLAENNPKPDLPNMDFLIDKLQPDLECFQRTVGRDFSHWCP